ncbi:conserved hypothetical protein [Ricinus communis]|uniref:Uncharacterized protein n=1 Tax=Ricinus communis TaxID=3988 RepID=B9S3C0_RICCO|nr:conserved hypothetical protein [Ricinus communis]
MNATKNSDAEFAYGSGHINPVKAVSPGLVMGYTTERIKLLSGNSSCPEGSDRLSTKDFNYPSMTAEVFASTSFNVGFHRTVTNIGHSNSTYKAKVFSDSKVDIKVVPEVLSFKSLHEKKSFHVTAVGRGLPAGSKTMVSASLVWPDDIHSVRSLIVVKFGLEIYARDSDGRLEEKVKLGCPIKWRSSCTVFLGTCNGLILAKVPHKLLLWKPFTRQCKILPESRSENDNVFRDYPLWYDAYGLGYDAATNDYKVVSIQKPRRFDKFKLNWRTTGMLVNGVLHWLFIDGKTGLRLMAAFDILTEKFYTLQLPGNLKKYIKLHLSKERRFYLSSCSRKYDRLYDSEVDIYAGEKHGAT